MNERFLFFYLKLVIFNCFFFFSIDLRIWFAETIKKLSEERVLLCELDVTLLNCGVTLNNVYSSDKRNRFSFVDYFHQIQSESFWWTSILVIKSQAFFEIQFFKMWVASKIWARSVQPFWSLFDSHRLILDTNRQAKSPDLDPRHCIFKNAKIQKITKNE